MVVRFFIILCLTGFTLTASGEDVPHYLAVKFVESYTSPTGSKITFEDLKSFKSLNESGSSAHRIYEITLYNGTSIILKDLKEDKYQAELDRLLIIEPFLTAYETKATMDMPKFARYRGHFVLTGGLSDKDEMTHHFILFDVAPGQSLFDWLEHLVPDDHSPATLDKIYASLRMVGASIAQFHLANKIELDDEFKTILHGDLHLGNIFLEVEPGFRLTFIDYESVAGYLPSPTPVDWDLHRLFEFSLPGLMGRIIEAAKKNFYKDNDKDSLFLSKTEIDKRDTYVDTKLNQLNSYMKKITQGYNQDIGQHGWALTSYPLRLIKNRY